MTNERPDHVPADMTTEEWNNTDDAYKHAVMWTQTAEPSFPVDDPTRSY